jgi:hypothetical protein
MLMSTTAAPAGSSPISCRRAALLVQELAGEQERGGGLQGADGGHDGELVVLAGE